MNSETKITTKRDLKHKILLGLISILLVNYFAFGFGPIQTQTQSQSASQNSVASGNLSPLGIPVAKADGSLDCTVGTLSVCPLTAINISRFPGQITMGQPFTFRLHLNSTNYDEANSNTWLTNWVGMNIYVCPKSEGSCDHTDDGKTLRITDVTFNPKLQHQSDNVDITAPALTSNLDWLKDASQLPLQGFSLKFEYILVGTLSDGTQVQAEHQFDYVDANIQAGSNSGTPTITIKPTPQTSFGSPGTLGSDIATYRIQGSINGQSNPPGFSWSWGLGTSQTGPFNDVAFAKNLTDFTFPTSGANALDKTKDYWIVATVTNTNTTANLGFTPGQSITSTPATAMPFASSINQRNNNPCSQSLWSVVVCVLEAFIVTAVNIVRGIFVAFFSLLIAPVMQAMLSIDPSNPAFAGVILQGWVVIRNLMNILFVLALIIMALATLLRIGEQWNFRHLLVEIILAALFINFSLVLCQAVLSIAQAFQAQFLPHNDVVVGKLAAQLIGNPFVTQNASLWNLTGELSGIVSSVFGLIFAFGALLIFADITVFLMIRIMALWILMMISPVIFGFMAIPPLEHEGKLVAQKFFQYAMFTPVMALGLNLCALIADAQRLYVQSGAINQTFTTSSSIQSGLAGFIGNVLTNVLLIVCLFAVLEVAKHFSIAGSNKLISWTEKAVEKPLHFAGHAMGNWALQKKYAATAGLARGNMLQRGLFNVLNPELRAKAFNEAAHHKLDESKSKALGAAQFLEEKRRTHGLDNKADVNAERKAEASRETFFADNTKEQNLGQLEKMEGMSGHTEEKIALLRVMMANGQFKANISKRLGKDANGQDIPYNAENVGQYLRNFVGDDAQGKRFLAVDLTKRAQDAGHFEAGNAVVALADGSYVDGDATGGKIAEFLSGDARAALEKAGGSADNISAQKAAMLNSIAGIDLEKRGNIKLNVKSYIGKDGAGRPTIKSADRAMINLVTAGGAETARTMSSGQREAFQLTKNIDLNNGTLHFDNDFDAQAFEMLYGGDDNRQARDFATTSFAKAVGIDDLRNQNFDGIGISIGSDGSAPTSVRVIGGDGVSKIHNGNHEIDYSAQQTIKVGIQGRKPTKQMASKGNQGGRGDNDQDGGSGGGGQRQTGGGGGTNISSAAGDSGNASGSTLVDQFGRAIS